MKSITFLVLTLIICSYRGDKVEEKVIDLLIPPQTELTKISGIATNIEYIPLQTSENSIFKFIIDIKRTQNSLFIRSNTNEIFYFDNNGKYLFKLSRIGRGPEEYENIYDFDVTEKNDQLLILTRSRIQFYKVTKNGFVYYKTLKLQDYPGFMDICPNQKNILLSYGSLGLELNRYIVIDMNGEIQKTIPNNYKYSKKTEDYFVATYENIQFKSDNLLHFKYWLNDTVFTLTADNNILPYMIFNSHGKHTTTDVLENNSNIREISSKYLNVYSIFETSRYLIYRYYYGSVCVRVYDKISKSTFYIDYKQKETTKWLTDDLIGGVNIEPKLDINGNVYSWVDALTLKKYVSSSEFKNSVVKFPDKKVELQRLAESMDELDNPILILVTPQK